MRSSKLSTSNDYPALVRQKAAEGDHLWLLNELLSRIHQDHGQYTTLAGLPTSFEDALTILSLSRGSLRASKARLNT